VVKTRWKVISAKTYIGYSRNDDKKVLRPSLKTFWRSHRGHWRWRSSVAI